MDLLSGITHIHHASFKIEKEQFTIYIDPFDITENINDATYILCTHSHHDHLSLADIQKVMNKNTILFVTKDAIEKVKNLNVKKIIYVEPDFSYEDEKIAFTTVRAYNPNKKFHPKVNNWVGYIIDISGYKYYFAGDTDFIPEMRKIKADVVFLPVGGTYTMDAIEAVQVANIIQPKIAVPIHFAHIVGNHEDAEYFLENIDKTIECKILI